MGAESDTVQTGATIASSWFDKLTTSDFSRSS
jgi:hypothetical protein